MVIEVGLPAAVFGPAAVLMVTLLLVNRRGSKGFFTIAGRNS